MPMRVMAQLNETLAFVWKDKDDDECLQRLKTHELTTTKKFTKMILNDDGQPDLIKQIEQMQVKYTGQVLLTDQRKSSVMLPTASQGQLTSGGRNGMSTSEKVNECAHSSDEGSNNGDDSISQADSFARMGDKIVKDNNSDVNLQTVNQTDDDKGGKFSYKPVRKTDYSMNLVDL